MGLDMYLHRKGKSKDKEYKEVGYWRKANAIHGWIVRNVQGGVDDCGQYEFPVEKMVELYFLCKRVLKNKREDYLELPTTQGCFFGSYEYDIYYLEYVNYTAKVLKKALKKPKYKYIYGSSW